VTFLADIRSNTHVFNEARTADEILTSSCIFHALLLLTVDKPSEVRLFAPAAHVKADLCLGKLHDLTEIKISRSRDSRIFVQVLVSRYLHRLDLQLRAQDCQFFNLICDFPDMRRLDGLLAHWTEHEIESDAQSSPFMFQQL